jgi:tRNA A37 threonylcarbamoyladenosine biosynthesis protein TsaE
MMAYKGSAPGPDYAFVHLTQQFGAGKTVLMGHLAEQCAMAIEAGPTSPLFHQLAQAHQLRYCRQYSLVIGGYNFNV